MEGVSYERGTPVVAGLDEGGRWKATWTREFNLPWREAVNTEVSLWQRKRTTREWLTSSLTSSSEWATAGYIYMYIYVYIYIYIYVCVCVHTYTYMHIYIYATQCPDTVQCSIAGVTMVKSLRPSYTGLCPQNILYEKTLNLKLSGNDGCYTA